MPEMIVANSFSKNFGLYRERAASLSFVFANPQQADAGFSQLLNVARGIYSMPPAHGSTIVDIILHSEELTRLWQSELTQMRDRIAGLRVQLVESLNALQQARDFSFIARERGMFSFLGLTVEQVHTLKNEYSIYMTDTSRISVAGLTTEKMDYVAKAIIAVL
jgi:aspartate aminotransferase